MDLKIRNRSQLYSYRWTQSMKTQKKLNLNFAILKKKNLEVKYKRIDVLYSMILIKAKYDLRKKMNFKI